MKKFGCISPSVLQLPSDIYRVLPSSVQANIVTLNVRNGRPGEFERALGILRGATDVLLDEGSEAIVVMGVPVAARRGFATEQREHDALTADRGAVPIISSLAASTLALKALQVKYPLIITQYNAEVNRQIRDFYRDAGLDVAGAVGLGATNAQQVNALTADDYERLAHEALDACPRADGIFLSARGNLLDLTLRLENSKRLPVIEQIQASIWWSLSNLGARTDVPRGRLLQQLAAPGAS
jgi:maleate cis-trans isomerase